MAQTTITKKIKSAIKDGNGLWNFDFWKGYCRAYDDFKNLVPNI